MIGFYTLSIINFDMYTEYDMYIMYNNVEELLSLSVMLYIHFLYTVYHTIAHSNFVS